MNREPIRVLIIDAEPFHAEPVPESLQSVGYDSVIPTTGPGEKAGAPATAVYSCCQKARN